MGNVEEQEQDLFQKSLARIWFLDPFLRYEGD